MEQAPPPFFNRGPTPLALLTFYVAVAIAAQILDARFKYLEVVRQIVSIVTHPVQVVAQMPSHGVLALSDYFANVSRLQDENARLRQAQLAGAPALQRIQQLELENDNLRKLVSVRERQKASGSAARIVYAARDPFSRRVVIDRGQQEGVSAGQPVIDEIGVVGQVTRVFPFASEVTLVTDKDQSVPVQIVRNGLRSVAFGVGGGRLELRYMPGNADVQDGDVLVTSGLDGVYLPGFPVAKVIQVERDRTYTFARILCEPIAGVENRDIVMLLDPRKGEPPRPEGIDLGTPGAGSGERARSSGKRRPPRRP